jgi:tetratricopeptide (TPR) repeat protein
MANNLFATLERARVLFDAGQLDAAENELFPVLQGLPQSVEAHVLAGVIAAQKNNPIAATKHLSAALRLDPERVDALTWLGMVRKSQNDYAGAVKVISRAVAIDRNDGARLNLLGICHLQLGQARQAEAAFQDAINLEPQASQGYFNLGMAFRLQNDGHAALEAFKRALDLAPDHPQNYLQVFKQYQQLSRWSEAVQILQDGLKIHRGNLVLSEALAVAYGHLNQPEKAEPIFRGAAKTDFKMAIAYAKWLQEQGRFEDSVRALNQSIELQPIQGEAYRGLAEARTFSVGGKPLIEKVLGIIDRPGLNERDRMHLAYALGKAFDNAKDYQSAMHYFDIANALAYRIYPASQTFDSASMHVDSEVMSRIYTPELMTKMGEYGSSSQKPIFIIGMIRSGTTLLDQIVSSHRDVASVGEQPFWNAEADPIHRKWRERPDKVDIANICSKYLSILEKEGGESQRITDKMPLNFRHLGLIHSVFPQAKILHIRRSPMDTCLSIYMTFFAGGPNFAYNQENIVAFYESYLRFMEIWRRVLPPDQFLEVDYEELVSNPEPLIRSIIAFLGLPWDDACLNHSANQSSVATPSRWQARQPIYTSSVEKWRHYEPWLGELIRLKNLNFG